MRSRDELFWPATGVAAAAASLLMMLVFFTWHDMPPTSPTAQPTPQSSSHERSERLHGHSGFSSGASRRRQAVFALVDGDEAFERLDEPQPGDWLWSFAEPGQTLEEYLHGAIQRKGGVRHRLHLIAYRDLNAVQRRVLPILREHMTIFFDTRVALRTGAALPRRSYLRNRKQYDAEQLVDALAPRVPADSLGLMALTGSDLFVPSLNFVFGVGSPSHRTGVYSLHRFGDQHQLLLRRGFKLSVHEMGHMFGLRHCVFYECVMNGSNSLAESDRHPLHLCPVCLLKLQHALNFDPATRYRSLARFYAKHKLMAESAFATARGRQAAESFRGR